MDKCIRIVDLYYVGTVSYRLASDSQEGTSLKIEEEYSMSDLCRREAAEWRK
jgi:hypothetical protein